MTLHRWVSHRPESRRQVPSLPTSHVTGSVWPGSVWPRPVALGLIIASAWLASAHTDDVWASGFRGTLRSHVAFVESRPLYRQAIPESEVEGEDTRRLLEDGTAVTCVPGDSCYWYTPGEVESALPVSHELQMTGWTDIQGLSGRVHLRNRTGSDALWPKSQQDFDFISGYVELDRWNLRMRAGRQAKRAGLGWYEFDGGSVLWRAHPRIEGEVYGGRSLVRGLGQPLTGFLLEEIDERAPNDDADLIGGELYLRPAEFATLVALYQREIRTDRGALYSERGALDLRLRHGVFSIDGSTDYDFAVGRWNDARARLQARVHQRLNMVAEGRYRRPYFDLWTIWEAFSPVGFTQGRLAATWSVPTPSSRPDRTLSLRGAATYRSYEDSGEETLAVPDRDDGWWVDVGSDYVTPAWNLGADFRVDVGFGAAETRASTSARRIFGGRSGDRSGHLGVHLLMTQQTRESRVGTDWIWGGGVEGGIRWQDVSLRSSAGWHRLSYDNRPDYADWNQLRVGAAIEYRFSYGHADRRSR